VLDAVTANLTSFRNAEDLCLKIDTIYRQLDSDGGGELSFEEFKAGLKTIPGMAKIHMTAEDFEIITEKGKHLGEEGTFNLQQFHGMMNTELNLYIFRGLCNVLKESDNVEFKQIVLMLKMIEKNIQTSIAKLGNSSAGESSSASLREDFDLRNEIHTMKKMQESHKEALDRQAETLSRILEALRHKEKLDKPAGVDATSLVTLLLEQVDEQAALKLNHSLSLGSLTKESLERAGRQKEGEHAEKKERIRRDSLSREGRNSKNGGGIASRGASQLLPSEVPWDRTHTERVANRETPHKVLPTNSQEEKDAVLKDVMRKGSKSKEMARASGATGGKSGAASSQFVFVTERGANGSSTSAHINNTRLRPDSNVAPYAPNTSPYDDKLAGT
jgi:hypothetical protein